MRSTSGILAAVGVVLFVLVQFLPWGSAEFGSFAGFGGAEIDANTWNQEASGGGGSDSTSWYHDCDGDCPDGLAQIRWAIPILLAGLVVGLAGAILSLASHARAGPVLTLVGSLLAIAGTLLFSLGLDEFYDGLDFGWGASFYLAIAGSALLLVGGIVGLAGGDRSAA